MSDKPLAMRYDVARHNAERVISLPDFEIGERYVSGETIKELAVAFSVSSPTIAKALARLSIERRAAKPRPGTLDGWRNPSWSGGRRQRNDGYWLIWTEDGERLEHRVVMERHLGRPLRDDEIVHHRDENKSNNDPSNLALMDQSEHISIHIAAMHDARYGRGR